MTRPSRVTFFFPYHEVSGVPVTLLEFSRHFGRVHGIDVEVVDYADGYVARNLTPDDPVTLVPFAEGHRVNVTADSVVVMQSILPNTI